jgi:acetyl esterase
VSDAQYDCKCKANSLAIRGEILPQLDAQIGALLSSLQAVGTVDLSSAGVETARSNLELMAQLQSKDLTPMAKVEDRLVDGRFRTIPIRVYWPKAARDCVGVTVFYHGGGFVLGSISTHDQLARSLAHHSNSVVISVAYALAPENKFPAAVEDALDAFRYAKMVNWELCDKERGAAVPVAVAGDSAGANLAAVVSYLSRNDAHGQPDFALLAYPVTDAAHQDSYPSYLENSEGYFLTAKDMQWFGELYLNSPDEAEDLRFSILLAPDLAPYPKTLIVVAGFDPLRDQGVAFAKALKDAGATVELWLYDSMVHGFFSMEALVDKAKDAVKRAGEYLGQAMLKATA